MGYHIPDAEDVYRYIFRLDRSSNQNLTDGFGWSILFVNDNSPICKEFLLRYGAELSYRTAERIRFVFFSGLDASELEDAARQANNSRQGGGLLSRIISATARLSFSHRRYDLERDPWDHFRPDGFYPLDSSEKITRHLNMECEMYSAMPGSQESLKLAQRLGIGRFVPCFLLFSDIGATTVQMFPIGHQSPEQVFNKLRYWIDSFYEINNATLMYWTDVEKNIQETCSKFRSSVYAVNSWKREQLKTWKQLQLLSSYMIQITEIPNRELLSKMSQDWNIPDDARKLTQSCLVQIDSYRSKKAM